MDINPNKITPEQLARLITFDNSVETADELVDGINDVARGLGAVGVPAHAQDRRQSSLLSDASRPLQARLS